MPSWTQYAPPPYSCTIVRTLKPAGVTSVGSSARAATSMSTTRPPSAGRPSSHQTVATVDPRHAQRRTPERATSSAVIGDDHVP